MTRICLASDNWAPAHPEVLRAIADANTGAAPAYGDDPWTRDAEQALRDAFGQPDAAVFPVFNGSGANIVGLDGILGRHEAVICATGAHINADECGAAERFIGCKLIDVPTADGKLRPADVEAAIWGVGDEHHVQARVLSITQTTELGTLYTPDEVRSLAAVAHDRGLLLHIDGARLANAAAALGQPLRAFTTDAGVDVVTFGATKNGGVGAEAVVYLEPALARHARFSRKQALQLASKMRFVSAQITALLAGDLWLRSAAHANAMAARLAGAVRDRVEIVVPVEANAVFARIDGDTLQRLREVADFHVWDEAAGTVRWMTSFATTPDEIDAFADAVRGG